MAGGWTLAALLATVPVSGMGQQIQLGADTGISTAHKQRVELLTDTAEVHAGRPEWVEIAFRVDPGLHINSHTPHDELLIPTSLTLNAAETVKVVAQEYPAGIALHLDLGAGEILSTYQGEFRVRLHVVAPKGESVLTGALHYQACDNKACYPPKVLPFRVALSAR